MINEQQEIRQVPFFYKPYSYQRKAWERRRSGKYNYYIKIWCRQSGKDTDDLQYLLNTTWRNPGTNNAYVGLDNKWVKENIFNKDIDRRTHWDDYPSHLIDVKPTEMVVKFLNNTKEFNAEGLAAGRIKFIGFMNDDKLVGNSYYNWVISEAGLYGPNAWDKMKPVWNRKKAKGEDFLVSVNGTPRGVKNSYYDLLKELTGETDPEAFPGEHYSEKGYVYVDKLTAKDIMIPDPDHPGSEKRLFTDKFLEELREDCIKQYGNDNLFRQEYMCDFTTVNAGLVYQAIEVVQKEGRIRNFNLNTDKPLYMAWDVASKYKETDATAVVVYQIIDGSVRFYDAKEMRGKSLVECVTELSKEPYFHYIRFSALPWDAERSASSETPAEECQKMFPNINWHTLERDYVHRGIDLVRREMPNMLIHEHNCGRLVEAFMDYTYTYSDKARDWSNKPMHNWASHFMDAVRYAIMAKKEIAYLGLNDDGSVKQTDLFYGDFIEKNKPGRPPFNTDYLVDPSRSNIDLRSTAWS